MESVGTTGLMLATVVVILALVLTLARQRLAASRLGRRMVTDALVRVLESQRLSERSRIAVVRYRDRELLLADTGHAITIISDRAAVPAGSMAAS